MVTAVVWVQSLVWELAHATGLAKTNQKKHGKHETEAKRLVEKPKKTHTAVIYNCMTNYPNTSWFKTITFH